MLLDTIFEAWYFTNNVIHHADDIRLVIYGRQALPGFPIQDFVSGDRSLKIHVRLPLHGGGPCDAHMAPRRAVSAFLVDNGAGFQDAMNWTQQIIDVLGFPRFQRTSQETDVQKLRKAILGMNAAAQVKMPSGCTITQANLKWARQT